MAIVLHETASWSSPDDFFSEVLPWVKLCPLPTARQAIMRAVREYLDESHAWNDWLQDIPLVARQAAYTLPMPTDFELLRVTEVWADPWGNELDGKARSEIAHRIPGMESSSGPPEYWTQPSLDGPIQVYPVPPDAEQLPAGAALRVRVALSPSSVLSTKVPPVLTKAAHIGAIGKGAVGYLMLMKDEAWTNVQLGAGFLDGFRARALEARAHQVIDNTNSPHDIPRRAFGR